MRGKKPFLPKKMLTKQTHQQPDWPLVGIYRWHLAALEGSLEILIECCYSSHCIKIDVLVLPTRFSPGICSCAQNVSYQGRRNNYVNIPSNYLDYRWLID